MKGLLDLFKQFTPDEHFDAIKIGIASPQKIRNLVVRRSQKTRDHQLPHASNPSATACCAKGSSDLQGLRVRPAVSTRWVKFKGVVCDRCGVEVTEAKVRRERMGHIELACPWPISGSSGRARPRIGIILDMRPTDLEKVVYYAAYVVLEDTKDPVTGRIEYKRERGFSPRASLTRSGKNIPKVKVGIGANAIRELLENIDIKSRDGPDREEIPGIKNDADRSKAIKRMKMVEAFLAGRKPPGVDDPDRPAGHPARPAPDGAVGWRPFRHFRPE